MQTQHWLCGIDPKEPLILERHNPIRVRRLRNFVAEGHSEQQCLIVGSNWDKALWFETEAKGCRVLKSFEYQVLAAVLLKVQNL